MSTFFSISHFYSKYHGKTRRNSLEKTTTQIYVIENHPCFEIWLLYYFKYTTSEFCSYEKNGALKPEIKRVIQGYDKSKKFLDSTRGLHDYLIAKGGNFNNALANSLMSMECRNSGNSGSFSEMTKLFDDILKDEVKNKLPIYINTK